MKRIVECCINIIRNDVVLPYIRASKRAEKLGMSVDGNGNFHELVDSSEFGNALFPISLHENGKELQDEFDLHLQMLVTSTIAEKYKTVKTRKAVYDYEVSCGNIIIPFANWRSDCSEYLYDIAKKPADAVEKFMKDEDPWTLYMSVRALCMYFYKVVPESIDFSLMTLIHAKQ